MITAAASPRVRFHWILDRRSDLVFYIGSALAGWAYVGVIAFALATLPDPLRDPLVTIGAFGLGIPLTLHLLVMVSWAFILDAPHVWATLGRTLLDPLEWRTRGRELRRSFAFFVLGPAAILVPYAAAPALRALGVVLAPGQLAAGALVFFVFFRLWAYYHVVRHSKLAYMGLVVPLHLVAFSHPLTAAFVVPLVTVGHNIQYRCIVYSYARRKYGTSAHPAHRVARLAFANVGAYAAVGLLFTFLCYRGPWIGWLERTLGVSLDRAVLNSLAMMAGVQDPAALGLGEQLFAAAIVGFALQHYYLDAKIWRVSRDRDVQRHLRV